MKFVRIGLNFAAEAEQGVPAVIDGAVSPFTRACALVLAGAVLTACGPLGDTGAVRTANALAVDCRVDEALTELDKAEQSGGLSKYLAGLERVGILRDAGRTREATQALAVYRAKPETRSTSDEEIESSLDEFIEGLREERSKKTGSATCPD